MEKVVKRIKDEAKRLLEEKEVELVLGYRESYKSGVYTPLFVKSPDEADLLVYDENCKHNLARYLVGREGLLSRYNPEERKKVALVANPAVMKTVVGFIQEMQFKREDVVILGIVDNNEKIGLKPDLIIGEEEAASSDAEVDGLEIGGGFNHEEAASSDAESDRHVFHEELKKFETMTLEDKRKFWLEQAEKCTRCYACRQVCPFCYCEECIADKNKPQWIYKSQKASNNTIWLAIRGFHLAGRCVECGECERACPVDIPLMLINTKLSEVISEKFGYEAGIDLEAKPPLSDFRSDDKMEFIL